MKTIKKPLMVTCKECEWMHSASEESCPMCGSINADRKSLARRKRKNKERQLKHTIARLYKERDRYKELYHGACKERLGAIRCFAEEVERRYKLITLLEKKNLGNIIDEYQKEQ